MRHSSGFTLIELVAVIVVISVGLAGLVKMFANTSMALVNGESVQVGAQYAQECAEYVLGVRRDLGISAVNAGTCDTLPALPSGYSRSLTLAANTSSACPSSSSCNDVTITVSAGAMDSTVTVMLVQ